MIAGFQTLLGAAVACLAIVFIVRGLDVRLVMLAAAVALGALAGDVTSVFAAFFSTLAAEQYVVPVCSAMGFAHVLRKSGCDAHLVRLLVRPLRFVRWLLLPGAVAVLFFVNIAIISQASTSVAVGTVLIPLLRSAGFRPAVVGSALLLGASVGGELLNPGAPELQSITRHLAKLYGTAVDPRQMQPFIAPLVAVQLGVAMLVFWLLSGREPRDGPRDVQLAADGRINLLKAVIPLVPLAILTAVGPPLDWFHVPESWVTSADHPGPYGPRLIGLSMLIGTVLAAATSPGIVKETARAFFEGAGFAFANIVSIIATANAFGTGVKSLRLADWVGDVTRGKPGLVWPLAAAGAMSFAVVCGSGIASTESLYRFLAQPDWSVEENLRVGAVVSIAAAAGRTTSPAAAVVLLCASLVSVNPWELLKRVSIPLVTATAATAFVAWWRS